MATAKVKVTVPVIDNGQVVRTREVNVSKELYDAQMKKKAADRHPAWRNIEKADKAAKSETK